MVGLIMAAVAMIGGGATAGAAFFWSGRIDARVDNLYLVEKNGIPRKDTRKALEKIDGRLDKIEKGQARMDERAKATRVQRDRIEGKLDGLIRRLSPPFPSTRP